MTAADNPFAVTIEALVGSARVLPQDQVESQPEAQPVPMGWDDEQRRFLHYAG